MVEIMVVMKGDEQILDVLHFTLEITYFHIFLSFTFTYFFSSISSYALSLTSYSKEEDHLSELEFENERTVQLFAPYPPPTHTGSPEGNRLKASPAADFPEGVC